MLSTCCCPLICNVLVKSFFCLKFFTVLRPNVLQKFWLPLLNEVVTCLLPESIVQVLISEWLVFWESYCCADWTEHAISIANAWNEPCAIFKAFSESFQLCPISLVSEPCPQSRQIILPAWFVLIFLRINVILFVVIGTFVLFLKWLCLALFFSFFTI